MKNIAIIEANFGIWGYLSGLKNNTKTVLICNLSDVKFKVLYGKFKKNLDISKIGKVLSKKKYIIC